MRKLLALILIILIDFLILVKDIDKGEFWFPDESRHAMDGVFIYDFIKDRPSFKNWKGYALDYYLHYPALSLGHYPPFFALVEALVFKILGISTASVRFTMVLFSLVGGVFFFLLVSNLFSLREAILSTILFLTTPFIVFWTKTIKLDFPGLCIVIVSFYFLIKFLKTEKRGYIYLWGLSSIVALLTRSLTLFGIGVSVAYSFLFYKKIFKKKDTRVVLFMLSIFLIIFFGFHFYFNKSSIGLSLGNMARHYPFFTIGNWLLPLKILYTKHLSWIILILSIIGVYQRLSKSFKDKNVLFFIIWIGVVYLQSCLVGHKDPKYSMYWIPSFCVLASLVSWKIRRMDIFKMIVILICIGYIFFSYFKVKIPFLKGYRETAQFVSNLPNFPVLINSKYNGNFIFYLKLASPQRRLIYRGSKILAVVNIMKSIGYKEYVSSKEDIYQKLNKFGIKYIVVDSQDLLGLRSFQLLREVLQDTSNFMLLNKIKVKSTLVDLKDVFLEIYEYKKFEPSTLEEVEFEIPITGRKFKFKLR